MSFLEKINKTLDLRDNLFHIEVGIWNKLPNEVVEVQILKQHVKDTTRYMNSVDGASWSAWACSRAI